MPSSASNYLKDLVGADVTITSGDRTPQRNRLVGGVPNSAHLKPGQAYDFVPSGMTTGEAANRIAKSGKPFDQVIDENDHVHVSFAPTNRRQVIPSKMAGPSDSDILAALTGKAAPASAAVPAAQGGPSDDELLAALTGGTKAAPAVTHSNSLVAPSKPKGSTLADMLRTLPGGLTKGVSALAGLPGDVNEILDTAANRLMDNIAPPQRSLSDLVSGNEPRTNISTRQLPTSAQIGNTIAAPFGGFYEPQTTAGKYTDTLAQFAPAAISPGNALLRTARVAAPAVTSETAGQLTEGTPMEGPARFLGALAGGGALGAVRHAVENPKIPIPSTAEIRSAATAAYKRAEQAGVVIRKDAVKGLADEIKQAVTEAGIDPTLHPKATAALKRLTDSKGDLSLKKMDILRRVAQGAGRSLDPDESRIAHIVLDHIDDFVENLGPGHVLAGDTAAAANSIKEARGLWAKQAKSNQIDTLFEHAKNRAETVGGSGLENALRVEFRQLAQSEKRMARFTPDEQKAIRLVARGGPIGNAARQVGRLSPFHNIFSLWAEMGAIAADPKALALPVAGTLGKMIATQATKRNALAASELVRSGGNQAAKQPAFTPEMLTAILARKKQDQPQNNLVPNFAY